MNDSGPKYDEKAGCKSKNRYMVGPVQRFDQKNTMFNRPRWDSSVKDLAPGIYGVLPVKNRDGFTLMDRALQNSLWYLEMAFAHGHFVHGTDIYSWEKKPYSDCMRSPETPKIEVSDPAVMSRRVKKVAKLLSADMVGICELDSRWIYSDWFNLGTRESGVMEIPETCRHAIAVIVEMDYGMFRTSPTEIMGAASGLGYSKMAFIVGSLAHFIRNLGYTAIPSGNDTGLNIPIAIDAGLGELGRNGLLITPRFGPRVRIAKVLTDLPLIPDKPAEFGAAEFCDICGICAEQCPSKAIQRGERSSEPLNMSTSPGVMKWPVDAEKCFSFWSSNNSSCGNCIRVCPFNKPDTAFHKIVRWHVKHLPQFDRFYKWMDEVSGFGKKIKAESWWNND